MAGSEPLVFLPGMNCSAQLWSRLSLSGGAEVRHAALTETRLDDQIDRLLDELPPTFRLVGLSLGAIVAMGLCRSAPERVSSLVLMSTNPYAPTPAQLAGWRSARNRLAAGATARDLQAEWLPNLLSPAVRTAGSDLVRITLAMADDTGTERLDAQLALQATRIDERPALRRVRCPTTVIAAAEDVLCPVDRHREIADLILGATLEIIPHCAHLSPLEQPDSLSRLVQLSAR